MRKRYFALLTAAALSLALVACGKKAPPQEGGSERPAATWEPLILDTLNVEFSADGHDAETMLALQRTFPTALMDALAEQDVQVGAVNVTFGTNGEATETALRMGTIQLAFLSAEDYLLYGEGELVASERTEAEAPVQRVLVSHVTAEGFTDALRAALPALAETLAPYTGVEAAGVYAYDEEVFSTLSTSLESGVASTD